MRLEWPEHDPGMGLREIWDFLLRLHRWANRRGSKLMVIIESCCLSTNNVQGWKPHHIEVLEARLHFQRRCHWGYQAMMFRVTLGAWVGRKAIQLITQRWHIGCERWRAFTRRLRGGIHDRCGRTRERSVARIGWLLSEFENKTVLWLCHVQLLLVVILEA